MNIFVLDRSPITAAQYQCNKHIVKMPTETLQLLNLALIDPPQGKAPAYYNHPCAIWARECDGNFRWLLIHGMALCLVYRERYKRQHKVWDDLVKIRRDFKKKTQGREISINDITPFPRCFSNFKELLDVSVPDTVQAYRDFYYLDKNDFARWPSVEKIPDWWGNGWVKTSWEAKSYVDKSFKDGIYTKR